MWDDVDFEANVIRIRRIQLRDGSLSEFTKTAAGGATFRCRRCCARCCSPGASAARARTAQLERVFPAPGVPRAWPLPREGGGGPLVYGSFRKRYWAPTLKRLGLPAVTPHSARHSFISTLQAQGVEVGLVAKLAGHKNAVVTLIALHPRDARRRGRGEGARQGICGKRAVNGRATDGEGAKRPPDRTVSHFMKAPDAAALLREQHGEAIARKIALTEQRRARRARSKRRFAFWADVAARIENGNGAAKEGDREG